MPRAPANCHPDRPCHARGLCNTCYSQTVRKPYDPVRQLNWNLRSDHGITLAEFEALAKRQQNKCAICGQSGQLAKWGRLSVDHDHETGRIRGLLCMNCNAALGNFKDDPALLSRAVEYLQEASA